MHNILSELLISVDLDYLDWTVDVDWMLCMSDQYQMVPGAPAAAPPELIVHTILGTLIVM